ncbi:uncharacterized protein LOC143452692 [Clavelina lepadiformis]|uniref:uncharacterized protein LOC143452692 n=1 Tax=Clavelina lepadiformis TaxID=159417 RepID=UPI00404247DE
MLENFNRTKIVKQILNKIRRYLSSVEMNWDAVCFHVAHVAGRPLVDYAFIGTPVSVLGQHRLSPNFERLTGPEIATIANSNGSNFRLRNELYQLVEHNKGVFYYESRTRSLAYAQCLNVFLIVCANGSAYIQCKNAMDCGLIYLITAGRI